MAEYSILGIAQGITEWLPISSDGVLVLLQIWFRWDAPLNEMLRLALFLHLGTFFAALIYFRKDVMLILKGLFWHESSEDIRKTIRFLIISTSIAGILAFIIYVYTQEIAAQFELTGRTLTGLVGIMLLATGLVQLKRPAGSYKKPRDLNSMDGFLLGIAQGLAALPGLSRSGLTVALLLLRKFEDTTALRLSFLMSLPIVLAGNIALNWEYLTLSKELIAGVAFSFMFGLATIHILLRLAGKINFGYFALVFGLITVAAAFI